MKINNSKMQTQSLPCARPVTIMENLLQTNKDFCCGTNSLYSELSSCARLAASLTQLDRISMHASSQLSRTKIKQLMLQFSVKDNRDSAMLLRT